MKKTNLLKRCSKSGRVTGVNFRGWPKWAFLGAGLLATLWYFVRVIPKPSRAAYPCLQDTAPLRIGFLTYLVSIAVSSFALVKARRSFINARYIYGSLFLVLFGLSTAAFVSGDAKQASAAFIGMETGQLENSPIGVARGIYPGRVAWVHNPAVANYDGTGQWWSDDNNDQETADKMAKEMVRALSGADSVSTGWDRIFHWFNNAKGRGDNGYGTGEKIAIKINQNNTTGHANTNEINANPLLVLALLKTLIEDAGVPQNMITVYDASRFITDNIFDKCHGEYPDVIFVDNIGGDGRTKSQYVDNAIDYSADNGALATGLALCAVEATYLINMPILKGHEGQGVTFGAKNMYGMTSINSDWHFNAHDNFNPTGNGTPRYMTFTDWMAHKDMGEKTMLWMMDAIYPTYLLYGEPVDKWQRAPFNNDWPSSIIASLDGVACDSVSLDMFRSNWNDAPQIEYADQYLHEAALADDPPSGVVYDPDNNGGAKSLGVHEHWNNPDDRQYSRNLGIGDGIELVYVGPDGYSDVDVDGDSDSEINANDTDADSDGIADSSGDTDNFIDYDSDSDANNNIDNNEDQPADDSSCGCSLSSRIKLTSILNLIF
ncbi:MAG: DUF362 domain-containing protein [Deltaproteobacteria bacterium]|nr:DUF362 domain-containing protein [Deltaproteobacteria bacterium]